eukprot:TRINITY_DN55000_c0_g1_i1.p1 TRINITY_DN55000_c0_g1~~TRINITY_DN55000_c0_g1_i1.p1  ORF type:complete len:908 (-),score=32.78 TRINITY_DN55000_c0_g1_i1:79-2649(-)
MLIEPDGRCAAALLCNRAACYIRKKEWKKSLIDSECSLLLDPSSVKANFRKATALQHLGLYSSARRACYRGLEEAPKEAVLLDLVRELKGQKDEEGVESATSDWVWLAWSWEFGDHNAVSSTGKTIEEWKEAGNAFFKSGKISDAIRCYSSGIQRTAPLVKIILQRTSCRLRENDLIAACREATCCANMQPQFARAYFRRAVALQGMGIPYISAALHTIQLGEALPGLSEDDRSLFVGIKENIIREINSTNAPVTHKPNKGKKKRSHNATPLQDTTNQLPRPTSGKLSERSATEMLNANKMGSDQLTWCCNNLDKLGNMGKTIPIAAFANEFFAMKGKYLQNLCGYAHTTNIRVAVENLEKQAKLLPLMELILKRDDLLRTKQNLMRRYGTTCLSLLFHEHPELKPGQVVAPDPSNTAGYTLHCHSFGNAQHSKQTLRAGETHVSIGFCDLGQLLTATLAIPTTDDTNTKPAKFVGYDACPYAVAKSAVILRMMVAGMPTSSILQVWYSSLYTKTTQAYFLEAVTHLLQHEPALFSGEVREYLQHWKNTNGVSKQLACQQWFQRRSEDHVNYIVNLKKTVDRVDMIAYIMTGSLLPLLEPLAKDEEVVGNLAMHSVPASAPPYACDELFLWSIPETFYVHKHPVQASLFGHVITNLTDALVEVQTLLKDGHLQVSLHHAMVSLENRDTLQQIQDLQATVITWSNLCDYIPKDEFHQIAKLVQQQTPPQNKTTGDSNHPQHAGTLHLGYSMNWSRYVVGASALDWPSDVRCAKLAEAKQYILETIPDTTKEYLTEVDAGPHVVDNVLNLLDFKCNSEVKLHWQDHYFGDESRVVSLDSQQYHVFARTNNILPMRWQY